MTQYSKNTQISRKFHLRRDPVKLRDFLRLKMPISREDSEAERYGKCAVPNCGAYGTLDRPLDLHHVIPRSQSRARVDDFTNHLYLCGDWFPLNHHKAIHGETTQGKEDWLRLGLFNDFVDEHEPCGVEPELANPNDIRKLSEFAQEDLLARNLLLSDKILFIDYAISKSILSSVIMVTAEQLNSLRNIIQRGSGWNPITRIQTKIR